MSSSLRLLTATDVRPNFSPILHWLNQPGLISQPVSLNRCPLESGYENKGIPFCPGTERWDRTPGAEMSICPRPRRFVPGQKDWDKRAGTERSGTDKIEKSVFFSLFPGFIVPFWPKKYFCGRMYWVISVKKLLTETRCLTQLLPIWQIFVYNLMSHFWLLTIYIYIDIDINNTYVIFCAPTKDTPLLQ